MKPTRMSSEEIAKLLLKELPNQLDDDFEVLSGAHLLSETGGSLGGGIVPDIVVYDSDTKHFTLIEVKGSPESDLPLATVSIMLRMRDTFGELVPDLIFISMSRVPPTSRNRLERNKVKVIEYDDDTRLTELLTDLLTSRELPGEHRPDHPETWRSKGMLLSS